jgi:hypothetical protein
MVHDLGAFDPSISNSGIPPVSSYTGGNSEAKTEGIAIGGKSEQILCESRLYKPDQAIILVWVQLA